MCFLTRYCRFGEAKTCENRHGRSNISSAMWIWIRLIRFLTNTRMKRDTLLNHGSCVPQPRWHDQKSTCCLSGNKMSRRNPVSGMLPFYMWRCSHRLPLLRSLIIDLISSPCLPGNSVRLWFFAGKLHTTKSQWHGEGLSTGTYFWIYGLVMIWVWVKIRYPNNWMVNTKLD